MVLSFLALAGALIAFRAGGMSLGWGFQLQQPLFVAALALLMFAVGLNLSGLYEFGGARVANLGGGLARKEGAGGSFFTGVLAVVVATPCTAPFMGAAMGYALTANADVALAIFAALGLGFAAPFMLVGSRRGRSSSPAQARGVDDDPAPGAGLPDVWRRNLAGLGLEPADRFRRRAGRAGGGAHARLRSMGLWQEPGCERSAPRRGLGDGRIGAAGGGDSHPAGRGRRAAGFCGNPIPKRARL